MIHPATSVEFINAGVGHGVIATKNIPKGTVIWALDPLDRIFPESEVKALPKFFRKIIDTYAYRNFKGEYVLCWDSEKYKNHSANPNCMITAYQFEIAIKDIKAGEEMRDDYGFLNVDSPMKCYPEEGAFRDYVRSDDLIHFHEKWDMWLNEAFAQFNKVAQPLAGLLSAEVLAEAKAICEGKSKMKSILNCYYDRQKMKTNS